MTLEKIFYMMANGLSTVLSAFNECQFWITDSISISFGQLLIGGIVGVFIIRLAFSNSFGG